MMHETESDSQAAEVSLAIGQQFPVTESSWPTQGGDRAIRALATDPSIVMLHGTLVSLVRRDGRDLTARQLAAFLSVYMDEHTHMVSSLAELLHISRPAVTRVTERLVHLDLVAREEDRRDRRRVLVRRTGSGSAFFAEVVGICRAVEVLMAKVTAPH